MLFREANYKSVSDEKNKENVSLRADTSIFQPILKKSFLHFYCAWNWHNTGFYFKKDY